MNGWKCNEMAIHSQYARFIHIFAFCLGCVAVVVTRKSETEHATVRIDGPMARCKYTDACELLSAQHIRSHPANRKDQMRITSAKFGRVCDWRWTQKGWELAGYTSLMRYNIYWAGTMMMIFMLQPNCTHCVSTQIKIVKEIVSVCVCVKRWRSVPCCLSMTTYSMRAYLFLAIVQK